MDESPGYEMKVDTELSEHEKLIQVKELTVMRKVRDAQAETEELNQLKREKELLDQYRRDRTPAQKRAEVEPCSEGDGRPAKFKGLCEPCYRKAMRLAKKLEREQGGRSPFLGEEL